MVLDAPPAGAEAASVGSVRTLHAEWVWVAVISTGLVGLWGLGLAVARRRPPRAFFAGVAAAVGSILVQVALGLLLYTDPQWREVLDGFHVFYGIVILFTLAFAYIFRASIARRPALLWGVILLFIMGLGIRAWTIVAG
jgi:hypothetical protein